MQPSYPSIFQSRKIPTFPKHFLLLWLFFLDLPFSPDRSYNFTCFSSFFRPFFRSLVRPSVHLCVCPSVRPSVHSFVRSFVLLLVFLRIGSFLLIFCMKLRDYLLEAKKWRSPIFVENSFLPKFQHIGYFGFFWKCRHLCFLKAMQNENYFNSWLSIANLVSSKFMFWNYQPKCSWPIRL